MYMPTRDIRGKKVYVSHLSRIFPTLVIGHWPPCAAGTATNDIARVCNFSLYFPKKKERREGEQFFRRAARFHCVSR